MMFASVEAVLSENIKDAWPHLSLDDQKRWHDETDGSKNPRGASEELINNINTAIDAACGIFRVPVGAAAPDNNNMIVHNNGPQLDARIPWQQMEIPFGCPLGPPPRTQSGQPLLTEILGPNGPTWREEEYCVYVTAGRPSGRELVIQHNDVSHTYIRLRDDVSNEEALRLGQALLAATAAPPEYYEPDEWDEETLRRRLDDDALRRRGIEP